MDIGPVSTRDPRPDASRAGRFPATHPADAGASPSVPAVTPPPDPAKTSERDRGQENAGSRERHLSIDAATRSVVSQVVDRQSGEVLSQVPDQALLRVRAYAREVVAELDARQSNRVVRVV